LFKTLGLEYLRKPTLGKAFRVLVLTLAARHDGMSETAIGFEFSDSLPFILYNESAVSVVDSHLIDRYLSFTKMLD
jgi:hypothetical protein